ncbi:glycosyltransferase [Paenibacillus wynnii]|uniref:glycosyltransferase n=1 Tax=Paenibacillus wynnii TaxID=268407 RepID=UPI002793EB70|nr:glycosyltransferase [Paenibacillus wynnii]MDQ0193756.1 GT2 family glycosyltransferase [Paenibacillus wynnii]
MSAKISVIIPVFEGEGQVHNCVHSLLSQDYPRELTELIFVDNGSKDRTLENLGQYSDRIKILTEKKRGSYCARNKGISEASSDILAFTDMDCTVASDWLTSIAGGFASHPEAAAFVGLSLGCNENSVSQSVQHCYESTMKSEVIQENGICTRIDTRNCAVRREVFAELGGFNEELLYWGDEEFGKRIVKSGRVINYQPLMQVVHKNVNSVDLWVEKKKKEGYWVYRQLKQLGRHYTRLFFPKALFIYLPLKNAEEMIKEKVIHLEQEQILIQEALAVGNQEQINRLMLHIMDTAFVLGTMLARLEEVEGEQTSVFSQVRA